MTREQLRKNIRIFEDQEFNLAAGKVLAQETRYDCTRFPGGEINVKIGGFDVVPAPAMLKRLPLPWQGELYWADIRSSDDLMTLLLLRDAKARLGKAKPGDILFIPYMPYGRQDRACGQGEAFSLKVFAQIVNGMGFAAVISLDPHSLVTNALIDRFLPLELADLLPKDGILVPGYVVAPDAGAALRAKRIADKMDRPLLQALKVRHGDRVISVVHQDVPCELSCLVVDDICDGGATFLALADELKRKGAGALSLLVTHGIFSRGLDALLEKYDTIHTVNNISGITHPKLKVL